MGRKSKDIRNIKISYCRCSICNNLFPIPRSIDHSWSIVYCLDIAEIVEDYNNGINIKEAEIKLNTFVGLIYTFLSNSGRDSFFR